MILKSIPFSYAHPVPSENELSMTCKVLQVEGFAKLVDHDKNEETPPLVLSDIDQIFCGQEEIKSTLELIGGMNQIQEQANDYAKTILL